MRLKNLRPISPSDLFIFNLAAFLQLLEIVCLHNVYYLKLSFIVLIYCVIFRDVNS